MTTAPRPEATSGSWFDVAPVGDGVTLLTEPHADRFIRCNIWHVRGRDLDLVIDTGLGVVPLASALTDQLAGRRTIAIATHYHYDHTGGMHEFAERWIHEAEAEAVQDSEAIGGSLRTTAWSDASKCSLEDAGYELPTDGELLTAAPAGFDPDLYSVQAFDPTRLLAEGDVVDLGDRCFEVLHLPGHSPGSIGLWDEERGVLFSGDAVYDGPLLDGGGDSDIDAYLTTMDRLRRLPVDVVHGGHDPSFGRQRLVELCEAYIERRSGTG